VQASAMQSRSSCCGWDAKRSSCLCRCEFLPRDDEQHFALIVVQRNKSASQTLGRHSRVEPGGCVENWIADDLAPLRQAFKRGEMTHVAAMVTPH
jgi:hypothetical protein